MKRGFRFTATVLTIVLLSMLLQITVFAAGTKKSNATEATFDGLENYGTISQGGRSDWYYIITDDSSAYYSFIFHNESGTTNGHLRVYSERDEELLDVGYNTGASQEAVGSLKLKPNTKYYLKATFNDDGTGNYYFIINQIPDEAGETKETALPISLNDVVGGTIDGIGDRDFYVFDTPADNQDYRIDFSNISGTTNGHLLIYTARDEKLLDLGYYTSADSSIGETITLKGGRTYYAIAYLNDDGTGAYSFIISQCVDGHDVSDDWTTVKEPTCTEKGEKAKLCRVCGQAQETKEIKANGHELREKIIKVPGTWISLGETVAICDICGEFVYGRDWSKIWIIPAIVLGIALVVFGVINYFRTYRRTRRYR